MSLVTSNTACPLCGQIGEGDFQTRTREREFICSNPECGFSDCTEIKTTGTAGDVLSVWNLDHDKYRKMFRGIVDATCNRELGDGNRTRKWRHLEFIESHEARLRIVDGDFVWRDEFDAMGAVEN
jgi:hypothetical protein